MMFVPAGCVLGTWYEPEHVRVYTYIPAPTTFAGMAEDADSEQRVAAAAAAAAAAC